MLARKIIVGFGLALVMAASPAASAQTAAGRIVFLSSMRDGESGLFVMEADGSNQTRLTSGESVAPVWSPDGCKIVFRQWLGEIDVINADGSDQTVVVPRTGVGGPGFHYRSHFSPDGARILFTGRGLSSRNRDFFVVDADGSNPVNLTNNTGVSMDWEPSWSPDGTTILFASRRAPRGIYIMNADGTGRRRLSSGNRPVWSPDGSKIAFSLREGLHSDIVVMDPDGTNVTPLTDGSGIAWRLSWSPDGSRIAFETVSDDGVLLEVMNADGTNRTKLADQVMFVMGEALPVSWSPDGSRVVFTRMPVPLSEMARGGQELSLDIYAVDADGSDLTRLTTGGMSVGPAWSPTSSCKAGS